MRKFHKLGRDQLFLFVLNVSFIASRASFTFTYYAKTFAFIIYSRMFQIYIFIYFFVRLSPAV